MADKYRARNNDSEKLDEEMPEKSEKELRKESGTKVAKVAAKGAAEYFAPGVGGKLVDMASKTKVGQDLLNNAGKTLARNPIAGRMMKKADDQGLVDTADKAMDMISKNPNGKGTNNLNNSNDSLDSNKSDNLNNDSSSSGFNLFNKKNNSKDNSFFGNALGNGEINLFKLVGKKYLIITVVSFFVFLMLMTVVVSATPFANMDLTNGETSMTGSNGSFTGSINVVTPEDISNIDDASIDGKNGIILSGGKTLNELLGEDGLHSLNNSILNSAQSAGYGTGAAPAAAAQALIQNLLNNNIKLPYFWGGGHGVISTGADGSWGTYTKVSAAGHSTSFSNQPLGLDCSGFVSWALYNGGCKNFTPIVAASFKNLGPNISFSNAKTGDIAANNTHVVLILENRGENLLVAEAKGTAYGVVFSLMNENTAKKYTIVDMGSYYQTNCS